MSHKNNVYCYWRDEETSVFLDLYHQCDKVWSHAKLYWH